MAAGAAAFQLYMLTNPAGLWLRTSLREAFITENLATATELLVSVAGGLLSGIGTVGIGGKPAENLRIDLFRIDGEQAQQIGSARTNDDGRCDAPLLSGEASRECASASSSPRAWASAALRAKLSPAFGSMT